MTLQQIDQNRLQAVIADLLKLQALVPKALALPLAATGGIAGIQAGIADAIGVLNQGIATVNDLSILIHNSPAIAQADIDAAAAAAQIAHSVNQQVPSAFKSPVPDPSLARYDTIDEAKGHIGTFDDGTGNQVQYLLVLEYESGKFGVYPMIGPLPGKQVYPTP